MRYLVERNFVQAIGTIWMPACTAAVEYPLTAHDIANIGKFTRSNVEAWLSANSGDFQSIDDFRASAGSDEIDWESEESEFTYYDCVYGPDDL